MPHVMRLRHLEIQAIENRLLKQTAQFLGLISCST